MGRVIGHSVHTSGACTCRLPSRSSRRAWSAASFSAAASPRSSSALAAKIAVWRTCKRVARRRGGSRARTPRHAAGTRACTCTCTRHVIRACTSASAMARSTASRNSWSWAARRASLPQQVARARRRLVETRGEDPDALDAQHHMRIDRAWGSQNAGGADSTTTPIHGSTSAHGHCDSASVHGHSAMEYTWHGAASGGPW